MMQYDGKLNIALGQKVLSKIWRNEAWLWSALVEKLSTVHRTHETFAEYSSFSKDDQSNIKDIGGFVGGYLRGGRRKPDCVMHRQVLTLDIDFASSTFWDDFTMQYDCAAVLHSTHKHCSKSPRFRLVMPLDREVSPDEYVAIARRVSGNLNIELFDPTTFDTNRLMFWPSAASDGEWVLEVQDGEWLCADDVLDSYSNWRDISEWPYSIKAKSAESRIVKAQEDPTEKSGLIGAFCKSYSISEAIDTFLSDKYLPTGNPTRYTYVLGSTSAGLILYEDKFAYSHHSSDPCSSRLCNAFDIVRIHKFGHLDDKPGSGKDSKADSFKAMETFIKADPVCKRLLVEENLAEAKYTFKDGLEESLRIEVKPEDSSTAEGEDDSWKDQLEVDNKGEIKSSAFNTSLIIANDPALRGRFKLNIFDSHRYLTKSAPWRSVTEPTTLRDVDYSGLRNYMDCVYGIKASLTIEDSLALELDKNSFHPIRDYLNSLTWDGTPRVDRLLIDYFGADDTLYTREAMRKPLVGAVARVFKPGVKFDLVLVLVGAQGAGKSTFFNTLGQDWFSDTFHTVQGTKAFEQLQGAWIIEIGELAGLRKAEVDTIKQFMSKRMDQFRPAYGRTIEVFKRQCIFVGSTNNWAFLTDPTGNRRFMPVPAHMERATKSIFSEELSSEVDQIWAEATEMYKRGEKLCLSPEADDMANVVRDLHTDEDNRAGVVHAYLDTLLPENWETLDLFARRLYLAEPKGGTVRRQTVCVAEVWCECLGKEKEDMDKSKTRDINNVLRSFKDWEYSGTTKTFGLYGRQKCYQLKDELF